MATIRLAQKKDLSRIVDIYNQSIPSKCATTDTHPISVNNRETWFLEHTSDKYPIFVTEVGGNVAGWCSLSAYYRENRVPLLPTAEISYYVASEYHRQGIAIELIKHTIEVCPILHISNIIAVVLDCNQASINLLKKTGFKEWGHMPKIADFDGNKVGHLYYGKNL